VTLTDRLIPELQKRFSDRGLRITGAVQPCAIFPAMHPQVGDIQIHDDGSELTVVAGNFTHGHFANYDEDLSDDKKDEAIVEDVIEFLEALFADRVVLWGSHGGGGGWYRRDRPQTDRHALPLQIEQMKQASDHFVWSGPLT
jgi:hypothetical protein